MSKIILELGKKFPKNCEECPLFVDDIIGHDAFCVVDGEYTDEEIDADPHGAENMYYHGCLKTRPKNCPLKEMKKNE